MSKLIIIGVPIIGLLLIFCFYFHEIAFDQQMKIPENQGPVGTIRNTIEPAVEPCPKEELQTITCGRLGLFWIDGRLSKPDIERAKRELDCAEAWIRTLKDPCIKNSYQDWIIFYRGRINDSITYQETGKIVESEWGKKQRDGKIRLEQFMATHEIPYPPNCESSSK